MAHTLIAERSHARIQRAEIVNLALGLWLLAAPFALNYAATGGSIANDVVVGAIILVLAGARVTGDTYRRAWPSWLIVLSCAWLAVAPFLLDFPAASPALLNDVLVGVVVGLLALSSAMTTPKS